MFVVALIALAAGAWLLDSAVQNRNPVTSLVDIVRDPGNARVVRAQSSGEYTVARTAPDNVAGSGSANVAEKNTSSSRGDAVVSWCRSQIGKPYRWGATGPDSFDCSGLMVKAFESVGVKLPRVTAQQILTGRRVSRAELQIGDLVFPDAGHVGVYSGGGKFIEAPRAGKNVREVNIWGFLTARRVL